MGRIPCGDRATGQSRSLQGVSALRAGIDLRGGTLGPPEFIFIAADGKRQIAKAVRWITTLPRAAGIRHHAASPMNLRMRRLVAEIGPPL
jgi:hypothetical protein